MAQIRPIKITVVGDEKVGRTCLLYTNCYKVFPGEYIPNVMDQYITDVCVDGQRFRICPWDTHGGHDYYKLRLPFYPHTDCFLLLFSISSRSSYENVASQWWPEIKHHCPNTPIVLVGTKGDLRDKKNLDIVTQAKCEAMKNKIGAFKYVESSAIKLEGLEEVFVEAIRALPKKPVTEKSCSIL